MKRIDVDVLSYNKYFEDIEEQDLPDLGMFFVCKSPSHIDIGTEVGEPWMVAELRQYRPTFENNFNDDKFFDDVAHFHHKQDAEFAAECFERRRVMAFINNQIGGC